MNGEVGFRQLAAGLDKQQIRFYICGALASSIHGTVRTTFEIDLVADLKEGIVPHVGAEFVVLEESPALKLLHSASGYTFRLLRLADDDYQRARFERRTRRSCRWMENICWCRFKRPRTRC